MFENYQFNSCYYNNNRNCGLYIKVWWLEDNIWYCDVTYIYASKLIILEDLNIQFEAKTLPFLESKFMKQFSKKLQSETLKLEKEYDKFQISKNKLLQKLGQ